MCPSAALPVLLPLYECKMYSKIQVRSISIIMNRPTVNMTVIRQSFHQSVTAEDSHYNPYEIISARLLYEMP